MAEDIGRIGSQKKVVCVVGLKNQKKRKTKMANELMKMENALDKVQDPIAAADALGMWFHKSGLFGAATEAAGKVLALTCIVERKTPLEIARTFHIVEGKLSMRADAMLAEFRKMGGSVKWIETSNERCCAEFTIGKNSHTTTITTADAHKARWGQSDGKEFKAGSGWAKTPAAMLRARVISSTIRMLCPEIVAGFYAPEEIQDMREVPATVVTSEPLLEPQIFVAPAVDTRDLTREKKSFFMRLQKERNISADDAKAEIKYQAQALFRKDTVDSIDELDAVIDAIFPVGADVEAATNG